MYYIDTAIITLIVEQKIIKIRRDLNQHFDVLNIQ